MTPLGFWQSTCIAIGAGNSESTFLYWREAVPALSIAIGNGCLNQTFAQTYQRRPKSVCRLRFGKAVSQTT